MSDIIQQIIDAYHPPLDAQNKYQTLMSISNHIAKDNMILKQQIKKYQLYFGAACILFGYAGLIYYIES